MIKIATPRDIHARHLAACKATTALRRRSPGRQNVPQFLVQTVRNDHSMGDHSRTYKPDSSHINPSPEFYFLHLEREVLADYMRTDFPISLDLFIRITTTHGLAGSFDPDLSPHIISSTSLDSVSVLDNCSECGVNDLSRSILDPMIQLPADLTSMEWMDNCFTKEDFEERIVNTSQSFQPIDHSDISQRLDEQWLLDDDFLFVITQSIVDNVREAVLHKPRNSYISLQWNAEIERQCLEFFSPNSLRRFVDLYWVTWYIHWPVIHKSTFLILAAPCTLVAAMALIGASYSTDAKDRVYARTFCDGVEEMVFADEYFGDSAAYSILNAACLERRLRSLQAAHAMCLYQAWEGHDLAKRRARRHLFSLVVAVGVLQASCGSR